MNTWQAMDAWLLWFAFCGALVNAWIGWHIGKVIGHIIWAAIAAASWTRWSFAVGREHGFRDGIRFPAWVYAPEVFFRRWWMFVCSTPGSITTSGERGSWGGVGRWWVFPASKSADQRPAPETKAAPEQPAKEVQ